MKQLFVFRGFAHDPQRVLTTVHQFALVGVERFFNFLLRAIFGWLSGPDLGIAAFADSERRNVLESQYDPEFAFWHVPSLAHLKRDSPDLWKSNGTTT